MNLSQLIAELEHYYVQYGGEVPVLITKVEHIAGEYEVEASEVMIEDITYDGESIRIG